MTCFDARSAGSAVSSSSKARGSPRRRQLCSVVEVKAGARVLSPSAAKHSRQHHAPKAECWLDAAPGAPRPLHAPTTQRWRRRLERCRRQFPETATAACPSSSMRRLCERAACSAWCLSGQLLWQKRECVRARVGVCVQREKREGQVVKREGGGGRASGGCAHAVLTHDACASCER